MDEALESFSVYVLNVFIFVRFQNVTKDIFERFTWSYREIFVHFESQVRLNVFQFYMFQYLELLLK